MSEQDARAKMWNGIIALLSHTEQGSDLKEVGRDARTSFDKGEGGITTVRKSLCGSYTKWVSLMELWGGGFN